MNRCVHIFGGIGTKLSHCNHAVEVYKSNNYTIHFYENKYITFCVPKKYNKLVDSALKNDRHGTIVHVNSGGFWPGLAYQSQTTQNKLFICEASPLENDIHKFIYSFENIYNKQCPTFLIPHASKIGKFIGMPLKTTNPEWTTQLNTNISNIPNLINIVSKNDNLIDRSYIDFAMKLTKKNNNHAEQYVFNGGSHQNVSKSDTTRYQEILQMQIDKINKL